MAQCITSFILFTVVYFYRLPTNLRVCNIYRPQGKVFFQKRLSVHGGGGGMSLSDCLVPCAFWVSVLLVVSVWERGSLSRGRDLCPVGSVSRGLC